MGWVGSTISDPFGQLTHSWPVNFSLETFLCIQIVGRIDCVGRIGWKKSDPLTTLVESENWLLTNCNYTQRHEEKQRNKRKKKHGGAQGQWDGHERTTSRQSVHLLRQTDFPTSTSFTEMNAKHSVQPRRAQLPASTKESAGPSRSTLWHVRWLFASPKQADMLAKSRSDIL